MWKLTRLPVLRCSFSLNVSVDRDKSHSVRSVRTQVPQNCGARQSRHQSLKEIKCEAQVEARDLRGQGLVQTLPRYSTSQSECSVGGVFQNLLTCTEPSPGAKNQDICSEVRLVGDDRKATVAQRTA